MSRGASGATRRSLLAALRAEAAARAGEIVETAHPRGADVFHAPWIEGALLRPRLPVVVTLHDLVTLKRPGEYLRAGLRQRMRYLAVERASRIIVPTVVVAEDAVAMLAVEPGRVPRRARGRRPRLPPASAHEVAAVRARYDLPAEYLVWAAACAIPIRASASRRWRKRRASSRLYSSATPGTGRRQLPGVHLPGVVGDDDLAAIYTGARALVFPSDEEGFGLPPVEALACGTPVVASESAALREVLADRATFVDGERSRHPDRGRRARRAARAQPAALDVGRRGAGDVGRVRARSCRLGLTSSEDCEKVVQRYLQACRRPAAGPRNRGG